MRTGNGERPARRNVGLVEVIEADRQVGGEVARRAAQVFGEALHFLEASADLLPIEIDGGAADADDVEILFHDGAATVRGPSTESPGS